MANVPHRTDWVGDGDGAYQDQVLCPECGIEGDFNHVHPIEVQVNAGGVITTVNSHGTAVKVKTRKGSQPYERDLAAAGRGVMITIVYQCEAGHLFEWEMHFHKGCTYTSRRLTGLVIPDFREGDDLPEPGDPVSVDELLQLHIRSWEHCAVEGRPKTEPPLVWTEGRSTIWRD